MNKLWRTVSAIALLCFIIGVVGIGVGFFMGSSPVVIQNHGNLTEYMSRLQTNWDALQGYGRQLAAVFGLTL